MKALQLTDRFNSLNHRSTLFSTSRSTGAFENLNRSTDFWQPDSQGLSRRSSSSTQVTRDPGSTLRSAYNLGNLNGHHQFRDSFRNGDDSDFYKFRLTETKTLDMSVSRFRKGITFQVLDSKGSIISDYTGWESPQLTLRQGTYYLKVASEASSNKNYRFKLNVQSFSQPTSNTPGDGKADWTVMVYMAGDNLEAEGIKDFLEMSAIGSTQDVNVVVQFDRTQEYSSSNGDWTDTRRGLVTAGDLPNQTWGTSIGEANMGDASILKDFMSWGMSNYQADNYALVMWGHGSGFNVAFDDSSSDSISAKELSGVLGNLPDTVDLVGADACSMGMTEFAYEISHQSSVFVGSQELVPGAGWDYTPVLSDLALNPQMTAEQLGSQMVSRYGQYYSSRAGNDPDVEETLSAINLAALRDTHPNSLTTALNGFANVVMSNTTESDLLGLGMHRDQNSDQFGWGSSPDYCDVGNLFADVVNNGFLSATIRSAAQSILDAYSNTIINNFSSIPGRSTGLSIYFSERGVFPEPFYSAEHLSFAANTQWDDLLNWAFW